MKLWPFEYLRPGLPHDHCADVLNGSYDVPFNPPIAPTILDLGANIGAFTRWAAERWPRCTIHCYEPHPANFALLTETVTNARYGIMPAWGSRLDPVTIKMLATYVHSLGGGEKSPAAVAQAQPATAK